MTFRDLVAVSASNLRRMKLRTALTTGGIMIAIAAFVSMLSFGAGNQAYIQREFDDLGLFTTMQVYPKGSTANPDSSPPLDDAALERIASLPGVNLVYPYESFVVKLKLGDSVIDSKAQGLPVAAMRTKLFSHLVTGTPLDTGDVRQAIISEELLAKTGITRADSVIGKPLILSIKVSKLDSAITHLFVDRGVSLFDRAKRLHPDSLFNRQYRSRVIRAELDEAVRRLVNGFMNARATISETLTIRGVRPRRQAGSLKIEPVIVSKTTAMRFSTSGFTGNPADLFTALSSGSFFPSDDSRSNKTYSQVTIDFDPKTPYRILRDSIEARGYRTFSFAAQFEEISRAFVYIDLALAMIGLIALSTASLGIINTMIMSITERRKEIGVLKSLGADQQDIRILFLFESGIIGFLGTLVGIGFGWLIARIASAIVQAYMRHQGFPQVDLFALPYWLVLIAMGVGISVSVLAGLYPAIRASRVDPVEALRNE